MRGFDIKQIHMRSFRISGLTAKWGIGGTPAMTPELRAALVCWYDTVKQGLTNADLVLPAPQLNDLSGNGHHLLLNGYTGVPTNGVNADGWLESAGLGYGAAEGMPIMTDYTVCAVRRNDEHINSVFASKFTTAHGAFLVEFLQNTGVKSTVSYGAGADPRSYAPEGFMYQSTLSYNGTPIAKGAAVDKDVLTIGNIAAGDPRAFHGAYKSFILFNRTLTASELDYVKQYMA